MDTCLHPLRDDRFVSNGIDLDGRRENWTMQ